MMVSPRWSVLPLLLAALLTSCGNDTPSGDSNVPPSNLNVDVGNNFFRSVRNGSVDPGQDTVAVGGTVTWTWVEDGTHGVRFDDPSLAEGPVFSASGSVFSATFPTAGTFTYDCSVHGAGMAGVIVVR